jgi:GH25 family lysozyme M1 (1,4-beta-N-acetylmuramidase)
MRVLNTVEEFKKLQTALVSRHYYVGFKEQAHNIDGLPGKKTLSAVRNFLFENGFRSNTAPAPTLSDLTDVLLNNVIQSPNVARLIDISYYQDGAAGKVGDLAQAKDSGIFGVIVKAGGAEHGSPHSSKEYADYWQQAGQLSMLRGVYWFFDFGAPASAQAAKLKQIVGDYPKGSLIPWLDFEDRKTKIKGLACVEKVTDTMRAIEDALGCPCGIYTSGSVFREHSADLPDAFLAERALWVTDYDKGVVQSSRVPVAMRAKGPRLVQTGYDDGLPGFLIDVDRNYYTGTEESLLASDLIVR